jgi:surface-anchored protein
MKSSPRAVVLALALALAAPVAAAHAAPVVIDQGHVDAIDVGYEDGRLGITVHDESVEPDVERNPLTTVLKAKPEARTQVPADPAYAFLGAPGADTWILPEVQDPDLLWPGFSTEELTAGTFAGDAVRIHLLGVAGPGRVAVFTSDPFGVPQVLLNSADGLPDTLPLGVGVHKHANWAFSRAGTYLLLVDATAKLPSGRTVWTGPTVLRFRVAA